jgi:ribosomal protein L37AE/L43A
MIDEDDLDVPCCPKCGEENDIEEVTVGVWLCGYCEAEFLHDLSDEDSED